MEWLTAMGSNTLLTTVYEDSAALLYFNTERDCLVRTPLFAESPAEKLLLDQEIAIERGDDGWELPSQLPRRFRVRWQPNASVEQLVVGDEVLRVGGVGGCFGPSKFGRRASTLQGYAKRHYTRDEIEALSEVSSVDIVLTHDAPAGVRFDRHRRGEGFVSEAAGLDELLASTRPRVCFFGHHHTRVDAQVSGVPCVGLNKGPYAGCLLAIERAWRVLGEWPPKPSRG